MISETVTVRCFTPVVDPWWSFSAPKYTQTHKLYQPSVSQQFLNDTLVTHYKPTPAHTFSVFLNLIFCSSYSHLHHHSYILPTSSPSFISFSSYSFSISIPPSIFLHSSSASHHHSSIPSSSSFLHLHPTTISPSLSHYPLSLHSSNRSIIIPSTPASHLHHFIIIPPSIHIILSLLFHQTSLADYWWLYNRK